MNNRMTLIGLGNSSLNTNCQPPQAVPRNLDDLNFCITRVGRSMMFTFPARNKIPNYAQGDKPNQHNRSIIHRHISHWKSIWHAKQHQLKCNPRYGAYICYRANNAATIPLRLGDLLAAVQETDGNWYQVSQRNGNDAHGSKSSKWTATVEVDEAQCRLDGCD